MKIKLLDKLIKASIKKIEEHLIIKCHLEQKLEMLNVSLQRLIDELENEQIAASRDLDFAYNFSNYCHHSLNRQKIIKEEITSTEDILENTKEKLLEISIEKKQYEFLLSKIKLELKIKEDKDESKLLDFIGTHIQKPITSDGTLYYS